MVERLFLFPGQGSQYPGMGRDLYESSQKVRELARIAKEATGQDIVQLLFEADEQELMQTENTQLAITFVNAAVCTLLQERKGGPTLTAGFSLGELSAYWAAGIYDLSSLFYLASRRGRIMAEVSREVTERIGELQMAAVLGLGYDRLVEVLEQFTAEHLYIANDNSSAQVVIAGSREAIASATEELKSQGARRVLPLKVSGPFHTPLMEEAHKRFTGILERISFHEPEIPVYTNVTGELVTSGSQAMRNLGKQLTNPVRWSRIMQRINEGTALPQEVYECGPGKVLSGFWKTSDSEVACIPVGTSEAIESLGE